MASALKPDRLRTLPCAFCIAACAAVSGILVPPATAEPTPGSSFFDDFETFDASLWGISHGWSNGAWQNCLWDRSALRVENGILHLSFLPATDDQPTHLCGEIQSRGEYGYGTYEARLRTPAGSGLNAAFFTYIGPYHGQPHDEIDIEVLTRDTGHVSFATYVDGGPQNGATSALPAPSDSRFTHFAFTWSATGIQWFVDGVEAHRTTPGTPLPQTAQKVYASLWGSDTFTDWMGPFVAPETPVVMEVDWIAFTAEGEACQFAASLLCQGDAS